MKDIFQDDFKNYIHEEIERIELELSKGNHLYVIGDSFFLFTILVRPFATLKLI